MKKELEIIAIIRNMLLPEATLFFMCVVPSVHCFDTVGLASERASGL